jgi:hypothetical protein
MTRTRLAIAATSLMACLWMPAAQAQAPATGAGTNASADARFIAARDAIWEKEKNIYKGRAEAGLTYYLANTSDRYVGWPPGQPKPSNLDALRKSAAGVNRKNSEKLELTFTDFTLQDSTAVIYYQTHRTVLPSGKQVDERFDTIHVWVREGTDWKLIGAMARPRS